VPIGARIIPPIALFFFSLEGTYPNNDYMGSKRGKTRKRMNSKEVAEKPITILPTGGYILTDLADDVMFCASSRARRDGGYVFNRNLWEWVPSKVNGELSRKSLEGSHPLCVVVGTGKLCVDFVNGLHSQTGTPELAVYCVESLEVTLLVTLFDSFRSLYLGPQVLLDDQGKKSSIWGYRRWNKWRRRSSHFECGPPR
jgi:hypothetical protein